MVLHATVRLALNDLDRREEAEQLGRDPDFFIEFAERRLAQRLPRLHKSAREGEDVLQGWAGARGEQDAPVADHGDRSGKKWAGGIEPVRDHTDGASTA